VRDTNRGAEALLAIGAWSPCLQLMGGSHAPRPGTHTLRPGTHTLRPGTHTLRPGTHTLNIGSLTHPHSRIVSHSARLDWT
jgi:hypothetical protein